MEEAGAGAEIFGGVEGGERGVGAGEEGFDGCDLRGELVVGEGAGGFVMHSVVC